MRKSTVLLLLVCYEPKLYYKTAPTMLSQYKACAIKLLRPQKAASRSIN